MLWFNNVNFYKFKYYVTKMKQKFSTKWVGSKQPRKQRKYRANAQSLER